MKGKNHAEIRVLEVEKLKNDYPVKEPTSPTAHFLAAGVPKGFLVLIGFCFFSAIVGVIGFIAYTTETDDPSVSSIFSSAKVLLGLGIVNALIGSLQTATGYCCQRLAHKIQHANSSIRSTARHPIFVTGLLLLFAGTIAAIVNLGLLGQSVTAPFAALTLLYNGMLARFVLREAISRWDVYSSVLVILGVALAVVGVSSANVTIQSYVLEQIFDLFSRSFLPILYTICMIGLIIGIQLYVKKTMSEEKAIGLFSYSFSAGFLSGFTSLSVKCTVEIVKGAVQRDSSDLENPLSYLFVLGIPLFLVFQLNCMNLGLKHFGTLKFVPPYHAFIIFSNMLNGLVYFEESKEYTYKSACLFISGCFVTVSGVMLLLVKATGKCSNEKDDIEPPMASDPGDHI